MRFPAVVVIMVVLFLYISPVNSVQAQLPTFGPSCDTVIPVSSPTAAPTAPPGQPTNTPAPTYTPVPTIPCSPTPIPPTRTPTPTRVPLPRPGSSETTIVFLGLAGLLLISGSLGAAVFSGIGKGK